MPATHVRCCDALWTVDDWLKHLENRQNKCEWTWEIGAAMMAAQTAHPSHADGTRISTTVLTHDCVRQTVLERQNDYVVNPADLYAMFRGTQFHGVLENWCHPHSYAEARFFITDLGLLIPDVKVALPRRDRSLSGSPDLVDPTCGIVFDYKRTKEVPRWNSAWKNHREQVQVNRWLVDKAETVELLEVHNTERFAPTIIDGVEYDLEPAEYPSGLVALKQTKKGPVCTWDLKHPEVRARFVPVDWTALTLIYVDDKGPKPIDVTKTIQVPNKTRPGTKKALVADIWDDATVERYIAEKYINARKSLLDGIAPIPEGWEHQSHALCGYCSMRHLCAEKEAEGV